jgi:hypothetical protein
MDEASARFDQMSGFVGKTVRTDPKMDQQGTWRALLLGLGQSYGDCQVG